VKEKCTDCVAKRRKKGEKRGDQTHCSSVDQRLRPLRGRSAISVSDRRRYKRSPTHVSIFVYPWIASAPARPASSLRHSKTRGELDSSSRNARQSARGRGCVSRFAKVRSPIKSSSRPLASVRRSGVVSSVKVFRHAPARRARRTKDHVATRA